MKTYTNLLSISLLSAFLVFPEAASALSVDGLSDGSLNGNTLTVEANVSGIASSATVVLWVGQAAPKDGDPANLMVSTATVDNISNGSVSLSAHVVLGTKVAFKIVATEGGVNAESEVKYIKALDKTKYSWNAAQGAVGLWSDPANWNAGTDNGNRLGYPAYGSAFTFTKDYVVTARVDAAYNQDVFVGNDWTNGSCFGWDFRKLVLIGITDDAAIDIRAFGHENYGLSQFELHNIDVGLHNVSLKADGVLKVDDASSLTVSWWFDMTSDRAYAYVGDGCSLTITDFWEGLMVGGEYTVFEIDGGTVNVPRLQFGRAAAGGNPTACSSSGVPAGIRFLGDNPSLLVQEKMTVFRSDYASSPVIEYVVPYGGYLEAPLKKTRGDAIAFAGTADSETAVPIQFKISERSPFFTQTDVVEVPLVDWSVNGSCAAGIDTETSDGAGITYAPFEDSANNFYTDSNVNGVESTRVWAHLVGTGVPFSRILVGDSITGSLNGTTLTVTAPISDYGDGTAKASLYVQMEAPNGTVISPYAAMGTTDVESADDIVLSASVTPGTKVFYAVVCENTQGMRTFLSSTHTNMVTVADNTTYRWVPNNSGLWSDPANWTITAGGNPAGLGYPSYGSSFRFSGNQTAVVQVDAAYTSLGNGDVSGSSNLDVTLLGTVEGASLMGGWKFGNSTSQTITLDGIATQAGTLSLGDYCRLNLCNGASMIMSWRFHVEGLGSTLYVGKDSLMRISKAEPYHWLSLDRTGSSIIIEDGTIQTLDLAIGSTHTDETPDGIFFLGTHPSLEFYGSYSRGHRIQNAIPDKPMFSFSVPEGGYAQAPIRTTGTQQGFLVQMSDEIPTALFAIDRHSPFLNDSKAMEVPLVSWDNAAGINTAGITLDDSLGADVCSFYYTPDEAETKTGLWVHLQGHGYTLILFR